MWKKEKIDGKQFSLVFFYTASGFSKNKIVHEGDFEFSRMVFMFNQMVEELLRDANLIDVLEFSDQRESEERSSWSPPPVGWFKINTNATYKNGKVSIAIVVQDDSGGMILIMTKIIECKNAMCAELAALNWATRISDSRGWSNIIWSSDAKGLVKEINYV